jgi:hypothetical protein
MRLPFEKDDIATIKSTLCRGRCPIAPLFHRRKRLKALGGKKNKEYIMKNKE